MLFCIGILIFGTEFYVGIFDRDGVLFSPIHDMFEATNVLFAALAALPVNSPYATQVFTQQFAC